MFYEYVLEIDNDKKDRNILTVIMNHYFSFHSIWMLRLGYTEAMEWKLTPFSVTVDQVISEFSNLTRLCTLEIKTMLPSILFHF